MKYEQSEVEEALSRLSCSCNIGYLHPFDKERIVIAIWDFAQRDSLDVCDIVQLARERFNWSPRAVEFLKSTVDVIEVLEPAAKRGDFRL